MAAAGLEQKQEAEAAVHDLEAPYAWEAVEEHDLSTASALLVDHLQGSPLLPQ